MSSEPVPVVVHCPACDLTVAVVDEAVADSRRRRVQEFIARHRECPQSVSLRIGAGPVRGASVQRVVRLEEPVGVPS